MKKILTNLPRNIETLVLTIMGIICISIPVIEFTGIFSLPFVQNRIPEMVLISVGVVALYLVVERNKNVNKFIELSEVISRRNSEFVTAIEMIRKEANEKFSPIFFENSENDKDRFKIKQYLDSAESIYFLGYSLKTLIESLRVDLPHAINKGLNVRIIFFAVNNIAYNLCCWCQENESPFTYATEEARRYLKEIDQSIKEYKNTSRGSLELKPLLWIPSCSMIIVNRSDKTGVAKIAVNGPSIHMPIKEKIRDRLCMVVEQKNSPEMFAYYSKHFNELWNLDKMLNNKLDKKQIKFQDFDLLVKGV